MAACPLPDYGHWRRRKGDLLRPDAFDREDIEELKAKAHNPDFEMLYQQNAEDRALPPITENCFGTFTMPPNGDRARVISVDASMSPGLRNSFSVIQVWCPAGDDHYLLDQWREQCDYQELEHQFLLYFKRRRPSAILIEKAANGHALISALKSKHHRLIHEIIPEGSKTARLRRHIESILGQRIILPKDARWRAEFVSEFVQFPYSDFTDQVDATTQYLDWISGQPKLEPLPQPALAACVNSAGQHVIGMRADPRLSYAKCGRGDVAVLFTGTRR